MSGVDNIEIVEYTAVDSIIIDIPQSIDEINIDYLSSVTDISVDYNNQITDIILSVGNDLQSVYSINNLVGNIRLSASAILGIVSPITGVYQYTINHNLNNSFPIVAIYNDSNQIVLSDIEVLNSNSVTISSLVNLDGYKVVVQV